MKAVRLHKECRPEQLGKPQLGTGNSLIRVQARGITSAELSWAETYRNCDGSDRLPAIPLHEASGVVDSGACRAMNSAADIFRRRMVTAPSKMPWISELAPTPSLGPKESTTTRRHSSLLPGKTKSI